jgi:hypothetical protein
MDSNTPLKTKYTGAEIMQLFTKKPESRKLTEKQSKITANLAYPAMFRIKMKSNELKQ